MAVQPYLIVSEVRTHLWIKPGGRRLITDGDHGHGISDHGPETPGGGR